MNILLKCNRFRYFLLIQHRHCNKMMELFTIYLGKLDSKIQIVTPSCWWSHLAWKPGYIEIHFEGIRHYRPQVGRHRDSHLRRDECAWRHDRFRRDVSRQHGREHVALVGEQHQGHAARQQDGGAGAQHIGADGVQPWAVKPSSFETAPILYLVCSLIF